MIDMVYLWCDGNEPSFKARKKKYLGIADVDKANEEAVGELRFFENEELRYSLRSLEKYAPWMHHVYIVTDRQIPKWLNLSYEKVSIVDHSQIMPNDIIPCFSSTVIEYFLPFIPNLSEKFLYGNDDMFFGRDVLPEDFFDGEKPIVRVKRIRRGNFMELPTKENYSYFGNVLNSLRLLNRTYNKDQYYEQHHNIDAYSKSAYIAALERFDAELKPCIHNRFRSPENFQRILFTLDMVYSGKAILKIVSDPKPWRQRLHFLKKVDWESYVDKDTSVKTRMRIKKYQPKLFCLNSGEDCSHELKIRVKKFMEELFPEKSKFEI